MKKTEHDIDHLAHEAAEIENDIFEAINNHDLIEVEHFVTQTNFNVNIKDLSGLSALHHATLQEDENFMEMLIHNGANVDVVNHFGFTPLMMVLSHLGELSNNWNIVKILVKYGANLFLKDQFGLNCFDWAKYNNYSTYQNFLTIVQDDYHARMEVLTLFCDTGTINQPFIPQSIQGISYEEAKERALQHLNGNNKKMNEEIICRQIATQRIPLLFNNSQSNSLFDYRLVGMIGEFLNPCELNKKKKKNII